ncbi:MAG: sigma-70 family RNA polymerase sigma factor [Bacteroidetes bacterium]|nr:sigma-70 family RNA polymerase sigma factor [Bacteroidota bacterium]
MNHPSADATESIQIKEIISKILNGKSDLYKEVVSRYDKYLYKIGRSYGYNHQSTEDLMQDAFVNAYIHLNSFKGEATFKTWLVQIMLHECDHKKRHSTCRLEIYSAMQPGEYPEPPFTHSRTVDEIVSNHELKSNINKALAAIPEKYRSVFIFLKMKGYSVHQTAHFLGISESNVKTRLFRAKSMLRDKLYRAYPRIPAPHTAPFIKAA